VKGGRDKREMEREREGGKIDEEGEREVGKVREECKTMCKITHGVTHTLDIFRYLYFFRYLYLHKPKPEAR
jgi:hypothetical protein